MKVVHASESRSAAEVTTQRVPATLDDMKLCEFGEWIAAAVDEIVSYHQFPHQALAQDTHEQSP
jgi:hypothetical protein